MDKKLALLGMIMILSGILINVSEYFIPKMSSNVDGEYVKVINELNGVPDKLTDLNDRIIVDKINTQIGYDVSYLRSVSQYNVAKFKLLKGIGTIALIFFGIIILCMVRGNRILKTA